MGKRSRAQRLRDAGVVPVPIRPLQERVKETAIQQPDGTWLVPTPLAAELTRVQGEQDAKKLAISRGRTFGRGKLAGSVKRRR